jgi:sRNA-binding regulator protein Hfq
VSYYNPYWSKALQYQQKVQSKPQIKPQQPQQQQQPKPQESKPRDFGGFDSLIVGKECIIKLGNGEAIRGVVSAASKYFYLVTVGGQVMVVNKAYVVMIMPIQTPQNNTNNNTAGDGNGREQYPKSK